MDENTWEEIFFLLITAGGIYLVTYYLARWTGQLLNIDKGSNKNVVVFLGIWTAMIWILLLTLPQFLSRVFMWYVLIGFVCFSLGLVIEGKKLNEV